jgi:hypothetical protein
VGRDVRVGGIAVAVSVGGTVAVMVGGVFAPEKLHADVMVIMIKEQTIIFFIGASMSSRV